MIRHTVLVVIQLGAEMAGKLLDTIWIVQMDVSLEVRGKLGAIFTCGKSARERMGSQRIWIVLFHVFIQQTLDVRPEVAFKFGTCVGD